MVSVRISEDDEKNRITDLIQELDAYCSRMEKTYGSMVRSSFEQQNAEYTSTWCKIIAGTVLAVVVCLYTFDGFLGGVALSIVLFFSLYVMREHLGAKPGSETVWDPRSDAEKAEWDKLRNRYFNRDYDRKHWAERHGLCEPADTVYIDSGDDFLIYDGEYNSPWNLKQ